MDNGKYQHPTIEELQGYSSATLDESRAPAVESHLAACATCRAVLQALPPDDLVALLQVRPGSVSMSSASDAEPPAVGTDPPPHLADHPRYRVMAKLGAGGMGVVYRAEHRLMKRTVALKVIHPKLLTRSSAVARFRREVEATSKLSHPNIAVAFDADESGGNLLLATEYIEGCDLAQVVKEQGPLPVAQACEYVRQAALGLQHAHERGLVHRDIKPHNLMLTLDGTVKILDFGVASLLNGTDEESPCTEPPAAWTGDGSVTDFGQGVGSPDYVAPEQVRDSHSADTRSDIYSLGCTLYFLVTGRPPFAGTVYLKIAAHLERALPPLSECRSDVPPGLQRVLDRMTAKDPAARYQTPAQMAEALAAFPLVPTATLPPRSPRRHRYLLWLMAVILIVVGSVAGVVIYHGSHSDKGRLGAKEPAGEVRQFVGHTEPVRQVVFSPDGKYVLSAGCDRTLRLWEVATGKEIRRFVGPGQPFLCAAFSHDGKYIVGGSGDATACLWRIDSTGPEDRCFRGHTIAVHGASFSKDDKQLLTAGLDGTVRIWEVSSGNSLRTFRVGSPVNSAVYSPDEKYVLTASNDKLLRLLDAENGNEVRRLVGHTDQVLSACFSPDGRYVLSAGHDRTMRLWDATSGEQLRYYEAAANLSCVAFSPDGKLALVGGWDRVVRLWEVVNWREIEVFKGHTNRVSSVVFSPDGRYGLSSGQDNSIRLWRLP